MVDIRNVALFTFGIICLAASIGLLIVDVDKQKDNKDAFVLLIVPIVCFGGILLNTFGCINPDEKELFNGTRRGSPDAEVATV
mmetsp:Transcript_16752/g.20667  ORF Transcript_16752/g.20667 Transcript_16752/m.20667 type:complete len:83 (+) Transcript_16752:250-498(+)